MVFMQRKQNVEIIWSIITRLEYDSVGVYVEARQVKRPFRRYFSPLTN